MFLRKKKLIHILRANIHFEKIPRSDKCLFPTFDSTFVSIFATSFFISLSYYIYFLSILRTTVMKKIINIYLSKKATRMRIIENQPCRKSILARVESTNILRWSDFSQPLYSERKRERESVVTRWHSRLILGKLRPSHYINRLNCRLCKECDWISAHNAHTGIDVSIETLTCKLPRDPIVVFSSK